LQKKLSAVNISQAWGRIFFLFGEREHPRRLIASVINSLLKNEFADCSHGGQIRDFMYVRDVADAFAALLDSDIQSAVNIASGKARTLRKSFCRRLICSAVAKWRASAKSRRGKRTRKSIVADTRRLNEEIGWTERYGIRRGLEQTIEYWKHYENND